MRTDDVLRRQALKLLTSLEREVSTCHKCRIALTRTRPVFGKGNPLARLVVLGEGPGQEEDKGGLPFLGKAGKLLHRGLEAIGYDERNTYFCNVIRCRACEVTDSGWVKNRTPEIEEVSNCSGFTRRQIEALPNKAVILAVGSTAMHWLLGADQGTIRIGSARQKFLATSFDSVVGFATYHPSYLLREENAETKAQVYEDFKKVRDYLAGKLGEYYDLDLKTRYDFNYDADTNWGRDTPLPRSEVARREKEAAQKVGKLLPAQQDRYITSIEVWGTSGVEVIKDVVQLTPFDKFLMEKKKAPAKKVSPGPLLDDDVPF
jgi:uracil-DNA glycosylase family 4